RDRIKDTLTLSANADALPVGPIDITLRVDSSIAVESRMDTVFRDHLSATLPMSGAPGLLDLQSNAMVEVQRASDVTADPFTITMDFSTDINLPIVGTIRINWSKELYKAATLDLVSETSQSSEAEKLRVGEFGQYG